VRPDATSERLQRKSVPLPRLVQQLDDVCDTIEEPGAEPALIPQLAQVREEERRRLAQELHDRVGQNLTALDLNLNVIRDALPCEASAHVSERLGECLRLVEHTVEIISDLMSELRSVKPEASGLMAALRWHVQQFSRRTGVPVEVMGREPAPPLSGAVQNALARIAQEALTNAAKHARGSRVSLLVESTAKCVRMVVADDGCGFDARAISSRKAHRSWGLRIMRERAAAVGARFEVESRLGIGTRVIVEVRR
jgi:signal transduction histidine kinase